MNDYSGGAASGGGGGGRFQDLIPSVQPSHHARACIWLVFTPILIVPLLPHLLYLARLSIL